MNHYRETSIMGLAGRSSASMAMVLTKFDRVFKSVSSPLMQVSINYAQTYLIVLLACA
jgi:hypothetical protein